ncbi:MAG: hypothetical protein A2Z99_12230 [Treponema sp. GWB1_62_6]|nr:MAG: hypothetical protein A2Y36_16760 [Treponema sp. GWA1_62_8]OHE62975.1 MAG: hypothetical protein A2Z99_12230 [Treponema sp. GWB1_62_6]OHE66351.1 MAG: hypothetical protein A2001_17450 [Treponema sp. GWC1_61_84]OHE69714.1 MAG: hypothetical protein A2413_20970 [Treponema sp. RIFOXYC1_FULL_61_9]HCM26791.1 hypothetical protein [Treponema sp.]
MNFQRRIATLSVVTGILALVYALSLIFDPDRLAVRNSNSSLLDGKLTAKVERIELRAGAEAGGEIVALVRADGIWKVEKEGAAFPAKKERIQDLLDTLSKKSPYPTRGKTAASHVSLGVEDASAGRIALSPLDGSSRILDLLVGNLDSTGQEVYLRRSGDERVFSGSDQLASFVSGGARAWLDLRLFAGAGAPQPETIQKISVVSRIDPASPFEYTIARDAAKKWAVQAGGGSPAGTLDTQKTEAFAKGIAAATADDILSASADPGAEAASVTVELGDGSSRTIRVGDKLEGNKRKAVVSGGASTFALSDWSVARIAKPLAELLAAN